MMPWLGQGLLDCCGAATALGHSGSPPEPDGIDQ